MSKRSDRLNYTSTPFELNYGERVQTGLILGAYEQEMKDKCHPDILTWHCIVLENFITNFLPAHGYTIEKKP